VTVDAEDRRGPLVADGLAVVAVALAGLSAVVIFLPPQGYLATPLHDGLGVLFGRLTFALPLLLLLGGLVRLTRVAVPVGRLVGLAVLLVVVLASQYLLGTGDAGLAARWLATLLLDALGGVATGAVLLTGLVIGVLMTFGVVLGQK
jgi:hypothetical protein